MHFWTESGEIFDQIPFQHLVDQMFLECSFTCHVQHLRSEI